MIHKKILKLLCLGLIISSGYSYNPALAEVSKGGSISFSPGVVIDSIPGVEIAAGGFGKIGFGSEKGTSSGSYITVTGTIAPLNNLFPNKLLQGTEFFQAVDYVNPQTTKVGEDVIVLEGKKGQYVADSQGNPLTAPAKYAHAFFIYPENTQAPELIVITKDKDSGLVKNLTTGDSFTIGKDDYPFSDYNLIGILSQNKKNLYNSKGEKYNQKPLPKNYSSLSHNKLGGLSFERKGIGYFNIINKQTGEVTSKNKYYDIISTDPNGPITAIHLITNRDANLVTIDLDGKTREERINDPANLAAVPKTLGLSKRPVNKVYTGYSEGVALVKTPEGVQAINQEGNVLFSLDGDKYEKFYPMYDGVIVAQRRINTVNIAGLLSTALALYTGEVYIGGAINYDWTLSKRKFDYINKKGEVIISSENQKVSPPYNNHVFVQKDYRMGIYDYHGKEIIPPDKYKTVYYTPLQVDNQDIYFVENPEKRWGLIDSTGKVLIPCAYESILKDDYGTVALIDKNGTTFYNVATKKISGPFIRGFINTSNSKGPARQYLVLPDSNSQFYSLLDPKTGELTATKIPGKADILSIGNNIIKVKEKYNNKSIYTYYNFQGEMIGNQALDDILNKQIKLSYLVSSK